jgi:hypothetical protein
LTLLVASAVFYMAFVPASVLILLALIGVDYVSALVIERLSGRPRRWALVFSLAARRQIDVLGSYDAATSGCGAEDLYDPSHPRPACLTKILALGARLPDSLN